MTFEIKKDSAICTRRHVLQSGLIAGAGLLAAGAFNPVEAAALRTLQEGTKVLKFHNVHTGENFSGEYKVGGRYLPDAFAEINHVLRDFRTGEEFPIDPRVMDIMCMIKEHTGTNNSFEILSGYRSPKTNKMLQTRTQGVAKNSLHMTGQAVDIRMPGFSTRQLREIARQLHAGGVGYYPKSGFVHVDTGKVRTW